MKQLKLILALILASTALAEHTPEHQTPGRAAAISVTEHVTVTGIDKESRTLTLKGGTGNVFKFVCDNNVRNFAQIKVGDKITTKTTSFVSISVDSEPKTLGTTSDEKVTRAALGEKPAGAVETVTKITAVVDAVDYKAETLTLKEKDGKKTTFDLRGRNTRISEIKKGDTVTAIFIESTSIQVSGK